jgi:cytosine/adenosine deaminase-related metal-dependent hydrolase
MYIATQGGAKILGFDQAGAIAEASSPTSHSSM